MNGDELGCVLINEEANQRPSSNPRVSHGLDKIG
jgi:hypothetical protein